MAGPVRRKSSPSPGAAAPFPRLRRVGGGARRLRAGGSAHGSRRAWWVTTRPQPRLRCALQPPTLTTRRFWPRQPQPAVGAQSSPIVFVTEPVPQVEIGGNGGRAGGGRCPPPRRLAIRGRRGGGTAPPRCRAPAAACAGGRCPVRSTAPAADQRPALTSPRVRRWAHGVVFPTFRQHRRSPRS